MKAWTKIMITLGLASFVVVGVTMPVAAVDCGANPSAAACEVKKGLDSTTSNPSSQKNLDGGLKQIVNVLLFVIGAIAVIMIVVGGLRYVISGGDSSQVKAAKDKILYAVIGLVVALLAYAIVNFVITKF